MHNGYLEISEEHQDMPGHDTLVRVSELLPCDLSRQVWQACIPSKDLLQRGVTFFQYLLQN